MVPSRSVQNGRQPMMSTSSRPFGSWWMISSPWLKLPNKTLPELRYKAKSFFAVFPTLVFQIPAWSVHVSIACSSRPSTLPCQSIDGIKVENFIRIVRWFDAFGWPWDLEGAAKKDRKDKRKKRERRGETDLPAVFNFSILLFHPNATRHYNATVKHCHLLFDEVVISSVRLSYVFKRPLKLGAAAAIL